MRHVMTAAMLEQAVRCLAAALALSIALWLWDGSRFSWHPTLMAAGFLGLMSEGVLAALHLRPIDAGPDRVRGIQRHALIQAAALACAAGGLYAIYTNKVCRIGRHNSVAPVLQTCPHFCAGGDLQPRAGKLEWLPEAPVADGTLPARQVRLGKPHFRTLHARAGLAALLLGVAAPLGGALAFNSLGLLDGRSEALQQRVKWAHRKACTAQPLLPHRRPARALCKPAAGLKHAAQAAG